MKPYRILNWNSNFIEIIEKLNAQNHYIQIMELYVFSDLGETKKAKKLAKQMRAEFFSLF